MKQRIFSIVLTALMVVLVAGCKQQSQGGEAAPGVRINQEVYSVLAPDGWDYSVSGEGNYQNLNLTKGQAKLAFHAYTNSRNTAEGQMQTICRQRHGWEYQPTMELGDNKWSVAYAPNANTKFASRYQAFAAMKQGVLSVAVENIDINDAEVQQILESVKMK